MSKYINKYQTYLAKLFCVFSVLIYSFSAHSQSSYNYQNYQQAPASIQQYSQNSGQNIPQFMRQRMLQQQQQQEEQINLPEFTASVDKTSVAVGQTFRIKLDLINADAYSSPDISVFPEQMDVLNQSQQSKVAIINGVSSKTTSWYYTSMVDEVATLKIPAISIQTDNGVLYTKPFRIYVKDVGDLPTNTEDKSVFIQASASNNEPFIDEAIEYKIKIYHKDRLQSADLENPKVENATIEQLGDPKKSTQILNGEKYYITEVSFLVTPIKAEKIVIEPSILRGKRIVEIKQQKERTGFDNFFDPFSLIDDPFMISRQLEPYTVASNKVRLNVKPARTGISPWLVLWNLNIRDKIEDLNYDPTKQGLKGRVGEPINRRIILEGYGRQADFFPDLENKIQSQDFKIYPDKASFENEFTEPMGSTEITSRLKAVKTQLFTFIPQKAGQLVLPELEIQYWSLKENKPMTAKLPGRVIEIEENPKYQAQPENNSQTKFQQTTAESQNNNSINEVDLSEGDPSSSNVALPKWALFTIVTLIFILVLLVLKILSNNKNNNISVDSNSSNKTGSKNKSQIKAKQKDSKKILQDIIESKNSKQLESAVKEYASTNLGFSKNASITVIIRQLVRKYKLEKSENVKAATDIDAAINISKKINFKQSKQRIVDIFTYLEEKSSKKKTNKLTDLNP